MNLENFLSFPIQALQGVVFTPILSLVAILFFMLCIVLYNLSGLPEKIENLTSGKKILVFFLVTLSALVLYYIFYKAGIFDEIMNTSIFKIIIEKIGNFIAR